jgi:hypothetical protein
LIAGTDSYALIFTSFDYDTRTLQKAPRAPAVRLEAQRMQVEADAALAEAVALKRQARLNDLTVWQMEKVKQTRKASIEYPHLTGLHPCTMAAGGAMCTMFIATN